MNGWPAASPGPAYYVDAGMAATMGRSLRASWNGGGDPAGVAWLASYLFDNRTHLNDLVWREGNKTVQFWTDPTVPGKWFGQNKPVYVLTGLRTFSGGEEFSYDMQQLKRATLVGETTGGGANPAACAS